MNQFIFLSSFFLLPFFFWAYKRIWKCKYWTFFSYTYETWRHQKLFYRSKISYRLLEFHVDLGEYYYNANFRSIFFIFIFIDLIDFIDFYILIFIDFVNDMISVINISYFMIIILMWFWNPILVWSYFHFIWFSKICTILILWFHLKWNLGFYFPKFPPKI